MLKVQEIRELIKLVDQSSIDEFVYEIDGSKIKMKKNGQTTIVSQPVSVPQAATAAIQAVPAAQPAPVVQVQEAAPEAVKATGNEPAVQANLHKITSPMVGTF